MAHAQTRWQGVPPPLTPHAVDVSICSFGLIQVVSSCIFNKCGSIELYAVNWKVHACILYTVEIFMFVQLTPQLNCSSPARASMSAAQYTYAWVWRSSEKGNMRWDFAVLKHVWKVHIHGTYCRWFANRKPRGFCLWKSVKRIWTYLYPQTPKRLPRFCSCTHRSVVTTASS